MLRNVFIIIGLLILGLTARAQSLEDYFREAADNNPGLQASYKDFEAAMQKIPQVSTLPDPTLSMGVFLSSVETRVGPQKARFSLNQMFPWFGTLKAQGDAAALMAEAKYQEFIEARNNLFYRVSAAYYPLLELDEWIDIEQKNIGILDSYKNIATRNFQNDKGSMVDVIRVDIMLQDARTGLEILRDKERPLLADFNKLLNRDENEDVRIYDSLYINPVSENFRRDSLLESNPVLESLNYKKESNRASEEAARKQGMPKLGVGLDYVVVGERSDVSMPENGKDAFMPMFSVSIPVFRKKYEAAVKESQFLQEKYELQYKDYSNNLIVGYEDASYEMEKQLKMIELFDRKIESSRQALKLLISSYSNSGNEFEEVLRMQQEILRYEKLKATALKQYNVSLAKLNYLTAKNY